MNRMPPLWGTAYGRNHHVLIRHIARSALRALEFLRALARVDRDTFMVL